MSKVKSPKHFLLEKFTKNSLGDLLEIHGEEVTKQLFVAILGREADEEGLQSYADAIGLHQSLIPAIQGLLKSGEFSAKAAALAAPEIVGAGSIVTKNIGRNTLAAGVPARTLRTGVSWTRDAFPSKSQIMQLQRYSL